MSIKSKTIRHKALPVTVQNLRTHTTHTHSLSASVSRSIILSIFLNNSHSFLKLPVILLKPKAIFI